jgi:hypothetical protein
MDPTGGERAIGPEWSSVSLLPARCTTETEVACELENTPFTVVSWRYIDRKMLLTSKHIIL